MVIVLSQIKNNGQVDIYSRAPVYMFTLWLPSDMEVAIFASGGLIT
jgi:hypothetical protein